MAIYSFRMQVMGRSAGRSATAAAAYRSGEEIKDELTGKRHDYTGKSDIYDNEILKPENAPERLGDRTTLWNEVEQREKRKDSQLCNEVMVALPGELTHEQKQALTREYVRGEFVEQGMIADIGYHDFDSHNPHAHIMLTMRSIDEEGFGKKQRQWNRREAVRKYRADWAEYANRALERAGHQDRIDHRSLKEQGIEREPQIHLGAQVMEMEAKGVRTRVGDESRRISKVNRDIARHQKRRKAVRIDIEIERAFEPMSAVTTERTVSDLLSTSPDPEPLIEQSSPVASFPEARNLDRNKSQHPSGVFETFARHVGTERLERAKAKLAESKTPTPPAEKLPEPVKRKKPVKQRQKKRVKEQDSGWEL